jgi:small subunit ribosomal protein S16
MDTRSPRDGRVIEELGFYDPRNKDAEKQFVANIDRCKHWLDHGAIPSGTVSSLLKKAGVTHSMLRLPRPGKPKVVPVPVEAAKKADAPVAATPPPATPAAAPAVAAPAAEAAAPVAAPAAS